MKEFLTSRHEIHHSLVRVALELVEETQAMALVRVPVEGCCCRCSEVRLCERLLLPVWLVGSCLQVDTDSHSSHQEVPMGQPCLL